MVEKPRIILGADFGLRLDTLSSDERNSIERTLTAISIPYKNNEEPIIVNGAYEDNGYLWIPRQYGMDSGYLSDRDDRVTGLFQNLTFKAKLDPARGQIDAVSEMVRYIKQHGDGLLVAPTGAGKTLLSYAIGSEFKTSLGVFIYAGHMLDNWIEQAYLAFGLKPEDIGIVQQDRCDLGKPITIFSIQSLLSRRYDDAIYKQIGFFIGDEINRFGSYEWGKVVRQFPGMYRLGVSADPNRKDGLDKVINWNFGHIAYTITLMTVKLTVTGLQINVDYPFNSYKDWLKSETLGHDVGDPMRYDKQLAKDARRNEVIIRSIVKARRAGRNIIVFSRFRDHLDDLKSRFDEAVSKITDYDFPKTRSAYLVGGMKKKVREESMLCDVKFSTYAFARDALNDTSLDTGFFTTPPGNPLQPAGRLRDKGPTKKQLKIIDIYEANDYSFQKWLRRKQTYDRLGYTIETLKINPT